MKKLTNTIQVLNNVKNAKEKMMKEAEAGDIESEVITNTELSCISALLGDIALSLAMIADHFLDKKGDIK